MAGSALSSLAAILTHFSAALRSIMSCVMLSHGGASQGCELPVLHLFRGTTLAFYSLSQFFWGPSLFPW